MRAAPADLGTAPCLGAFPNRVNCFQRWEVVRNRWIGPSPQSTQGWGEHVENRPAQSVHWYDITIAGKQFNIASRHGESHIRQLEALLERTLREMGGRVEGKNLISVALLAALNLADQLLEAEHARAADVDALQSRLSGWLQRLDQALTHPPVQSMSR